MDQALLIVIAIFVAISAIALGIQASMMVGVWKSTRAMQQQVERLAPKMEELAISSKVALEDGRTSMREVTQRTVEILDIAQRQLLRVDEVLQDAAGRARVQMDRAEMVVDDAMSRAQETVAVVHGGIMRPIREINAVANGVRAALHYFARGGRPAPDEATADEEMFI